MFFPFQGRRARSRSSILERVPDEPSILPSVLSSVLSSAPSDPPIRPVNPVPSEADSANSERQAPNEPVNEGPLIDYDDLPEAYDHCELVARDTLYLTKLPLFLQFSQPSLYALVQFPSSLLRGCISFLCGKDTATVTFVLGHTLSLPVELSP